MQIRRKRKGGDGPSLRDTRQNVSIDYVCFCIERYRKVVKTTVFRTFWSVSSNEPLRYLYKYGMLCKIIQGSRIRCKSRGNQPQKEVMG